MSFTFQMTRIFIIYQSKSHPKTYSITLKIDGYYVEGLIDSKRFILSVQLVYKY